MTTCSNPDCFNKDMLDHMMLKDLDDTKATKCFKIASEVHDLEVFFIDLEVTFQSIIMCHLVVSGSTWISHAMPFKGHSHK